MGRKSFKGYQFLNLLELVATQKKNFTNPGFWQSSSEAPLHHLSLARVYDDASKNFLEAAEAAEVH